MKLLIAEDDAMSQIMLKALVAKAGYDPILTGDGLLGLNKYLADRPVFCFVRRTKMIVLINRFHADRRQAGPHVML